MSSVDTGLPIRMSDREQILFKAFADRASGYFEFGTGGSTVYAATAVRGPLIAVDSDPLWLDDVAKRIDPTVHTRKLLHVDIGKTGEWGFPVDQSRKADFPRYPSSVIGHADVIDLCLVDGRFRVACFLQALVSLRTDAIIGVHDFQSRTHYHGILEFGREIAASEDLSFFVRRPDLDLERLAQVLAVYRGDPR